MEKIKLEGLADGEIIQCQNKAQSAIQCCEGNGTQGPGFLKHVPKSAAQRSQEYRRRLKIKRLGLEHYRERPKRTAKTAAERSKAYRERKRFFEREALKLGITIAACKTRWRTIRDSYRKTKNKIEMKSKNGQSPYIKSKYTSENLKFLDETFKERISYASKLNKFNWTDNNYDSDSQEGSKAHEAANSILHPQIKLEILDSDENNTENLVSKTEDNSNAEDSDFESSHLFANESYILGPSGVVAKATEGSKKVSKANMMCLAEHANEDNIHPIQTFFRSMASTTMTFPPHLIVEARMRVNEIISELELRSISEQTVVGDSSGESSLVGVPAGKTLEALKLKIKRKHSDTTNESVKKREKSVKLKDKEKKCV